MLFFNAILKSYIKILSSSYPTAWYGSGAFWNPVLRSAVQIDTKDAHYYFILYR